MMHWLLTTFKCDSWLRNYDVVYGPALRDTASYMARECQVTDMSHLLDTKYRNTTVQQRRKTRSSSVTGSIPYTSVDRGASTQDYFYPAFWSTHSLSSNHSRHSFASPLCPHAGRPPCWMKKVPCLLDGAPPGGEIRLVELWSQVGLVDWSQEVHVVCHLVNHFFPPGHQDRYWSDRAWSWSLHTLWTRIKRVLLSICTSW